MMRVLDRLEDTPAQATQALLVFTAVPGSQSAEKLALLRIIAP